MKNAFGSEVPGGAFAGFGREPASFSGSSAGWAHFGASQASLTPSQASAVALADLLNARQAATFGANVVLRAPSIPSAPAPDDAGAAPLDVKAPTTIWGRFMNWLAREIMPGTLRPR
jgi:hypothetical protein